MDMIVIALAISIAIGRVVGVIWHWFKTRRNLMR